MNLVALSTEEVDIRYRALVDVASALASHSELADLLRSLRGHLEPLIPFSFLAVCLSDDERNTITVRFVESSDAAAQNLVGQSFALEGSYGGVAIETGRPFYVARVRDDGTQSADQLMHYGIATFCAALMITARRTLGVLAFGSSVPDAYTAHDVELMDRVARVVAVAVENALNLDTVRDQQAVLQRERDQLDLLLDVTNAVVTHLDTRELFRAVAPALRRCCHADLLALTLFDDETKALRKFVCDAPPHLTPSQMPSPEDLPLDGSASGLVFRTAAPRIFGEDELSHYTDTRRLIPLGVRSACGVPLTTPKGVLGTLNLASFEADAFSPYQFGLLTRVAGQIAIAVTNACSYERIGELNAQLNREKLYLEDEIRSERLFEDIIGRSAALRRVLREIETVAPTDSTVLLTGETGSGKELAARAIHTLSGRRDHAFVKLNCAAIPTGLLESELFGHEKGAFTGAISQRIGRFELAHRGTVFLDEVGEIPLELQPKLLRVLQEREFERLGSARTLRTDARLIAATNRDLAALADEQKFRQDLFYRLNVFPVTMPPLRERREDVPTLVRHFAQQFARRMKKNIETIPSETMAALTDYDWPGNIRELQNLVERAVILSTGPDLEIPVAALAKRAPALVSERPAQTLEDADRRHITAALESSNWVIAGPNGAAVRLGMKRSTLQFRMRKLGIVRPRAN
jgi:formate hydrogenlyase transcriptional activator